MLIFVATANFTMVQSQHVCGTIDQTAILERTKMNKRALALHPELRNGEVLYVPLQFHIVTLNDGTGAIGEEKILEQLCRLNEDYQGLNIHFYLKNDFNYIAYTKLYEDPGHQFSSVKMSANKVNNAINIFIVDQIGSNGSGTTLGYYQPNKDWIVAIKSRVNGSTQTVSHEVGHFFSLAHPFYGWEQCPYNINDFGSPLQSTHLPQNCSGALIELMDGSNCEVAADLICDTPPDYNFGLTDPENNCVLDYEVKDYNGDVIDVMENNFMSYFFGCQDYEFTPTQVDLMRADFQSSGRSYLRSSYVPDTTEFFAAQTEVTAPAFNSTTQYYDHVLVDWNDVPGASRYLVKITTGFFTKVETYYHVKDKSELLLTDLPQSENNITVLIWPYNEGSSCNTVPSQTHKFKTGANSVVAVFDLSENQGFRLFPNPVSLKDGNMILWSDESIDNCTIRISDLHGRNIFVKNTALNSGDNKIELESSKINTGIYFMHLSTQNKSYSKKIIISN